MKRVVPIIILLCLSTLVYGQKHRNSGLFLELDITQGMVIESNDFVRGDNLLGLPIDHFSSTDLRIGWQTKGTQAWHHAHNLPYYGIGLYNIVFSNEEELGNPAAVYFFFGAPFYMNKRSSWDYEFSFGLSYNWKPYDDINNPFNIAIGSYQNAYIDAKIKHVWYMSKRFSLDLGLRLTHFSNGAIRLPNKGINLISPSVGLRYDMIRREPQPYALAKGIDKSPRPELNLLLTSGQRSVKGTDDPNQKMVRITDVTVEYLLPAGNKFKYGAGLEAGFDENRNLLIDGNDVTLARSNQQLIAGLSAIGQFRANRLGVQAGVGYELINKEDTQFNKRLYQRIGLRYYFFKDAFAGINIKARNFSVADYVEWSIGYSFM